MSSNWSFRLFIAVLAVSFVGGCADDSAKSPYDREVLVATMKNLDAQADIIWGNSGSEWDTDGERELFPTTDAGWAELEAAAHQINNIGKNLPTLINKKEPRAEAWQDYAKGITDVSVKLAAAAAEHNKKVIFDDGGVMYQVCTACHATFPALVEDSKQLK